jgi:hypothetical protein
MLLVYGVQQVLQSQHSSSALCTAVDNTVRRVASTNADFNSNSSWYLQYSVVLQSTSKDRCAEVLYSTTATLSFATAPPHMS